MNYQDAWQYLDGLQFFKIKLGLDSMSRFLDAVGNPQQGLRFVHIAGTNGKGSVAANLLQILSREGFQVGLYTSPHLSSVRERFRINDSYISKQAFAAHATRIHEILAGQQITYFEFTTALALLWFAEQQVDLAILEVGMGGRLDATNVILPLVSVITNVSMDHEAYLGDTLDQVAMEKAGIIKHGVPVVSGVADDVSREMVERTCRLRGAPLYLLGRDFTAAGAEEEAWTYSPLRRHQPSYEELRCGLIGGHQRDNAAVALATLEILASQGFTVKEQTIREGLSTVRWPARQEFVCIDQTKKSEGEGVFGKSFVCDGGKGVPGLRRFLIDGAHNPAGVESLARVLERDQAATAIILIWGSMVDKDSTNSLARLVPLCRQVILTRPAGERSADPETLLEALPVASLNEALCVAPVADALAKALEIAAPQDLICIAGSLYLAGEARFLLLGGLVTDA